MEDKKKVVYKRVPVKTDEISRLQPQARELEEAVLGALMLEKDAFSKVCEILKPEHFYEQAHQQIYEAIQSLSLRQEPVDILTVQEELKHMNLLEEIGGPVYLIRLTENVVSTAHLEYHARIVAQKYLARELIHFSMNIQGKAFDESIDVKDLMQEAEASLFELSQQSLKKEVVQINPIIDEALKRIRAASQRTDGLSGLPSGFARLDEMTSGWQNSDLIIIAARPAMGKTAFALSMAKNMAVDYSIPVGVFSLEMSNVQLVNRLIVNISSIEGEKIKNGKLSTDEWTLLDQQLKSLYDAPIYIDDTPSLSVFEFSTKARRLVKEKGVKILIIDYLQLMNASGSRFGNREQEVSMVSRALKALAKELDIPIVALSQVNRASTNRTAGNNASPSSASDAKRPQLSDLRESGAIEQDADIVCFIHRPEYYKIFEDSEGNSYIGKAELIIAKHRNGSTGDVRLRFDKEYARFRDDDDQIDYSQYAHAEQPAGAGGSFYASRINDNYPGGDGVDTNPF
ncbi:MAG: replicative DNA helicase [Bacteroidales bacterium]|nr:replicative DNA helicase [Bacteroidales bacterium]